jgi:hypothetical protein
MAGGGVGEAMLISAVTGAGTAAVTGGDPLKGALLGAATGGIGAGVAGGAGASAASQTAAPIVEGTTQTALQEASKQAALDTASSGLQTATQTLPGMGADAVTSMAGLPLDPTGTASLTGTGAPNMGLSAPPDLASNLYTPPSLQSPYSVSSTAMPSAGQTAMPSAVTPPVPTPPTPQTALQQFYAKNPIAMPAGLGALGSAIGAGPETNMPEEEKYSGSLGRFNYDPDRYRPYRAASGGLMDTEPARRMAAGGLGSYSDGGQMLKGPGDGMSDDIPASIGDEQPARLADGEFVVPADVVSGIGNGSTDAGAEALYAMLDRVRKARTGRTEQAPEIDAQRMMPA